MSEGADREYVVALSMRVAKLRDAVGRLEKDLRRATLSLLAAEAKLDGAIAGEQPGAVSGISAISSGVSGAVRSWAMTNPGMSFTLTTLLKDLDLGPRDEGAVRQAMRRLNSDGAIVRTGRGSYVVTRKEVS